MFNSCEISLIFPVFSSHSCSWWAIKNNRHKFSHKNKPQIAPKSLPSVHRACPQSYSHKYSVSLLTSSFSVVQPVCTLGAAPPGSTTTRQFSFFFSYFFSVFSHRCREFDWMTATLGHRTLSISRSLGLPTKSSPTGLLRLQRATPKTGVKRRGEEATERLYSRIP